MRQTPLITVALAIHNSIPIIIIILKFIPSPAGFKFLLIDHQPQETHNLEESITIIFPDKISNKSVIIFVNWDILTESQLPNSQPN